MPDVYATIADADPALVTRIAEVLELRAADPQQQAMRQAYLGDIAFSQGARVLEDGCGTGAVTRELAAWPGVAEVTGVDPSPTFLATARRLGPRANARFLEGDARGLDFQDQSFDVVVFHTTLCHVPGPHLALAEAARVLRPGGWLAVFDGDYATTTVALHPGDPLEACALAFVEFSLHDPWLVRRLPGLLEQPGFEPVRMRSYGLSRPGTPATPQRSSTRAPTPLSPPDGSARTPPRRSRPRHAGESPTAASSAASPTPASSPGCPTDIGEGRQRADSLAAFADTAAPARSNGLRIRPCSPSGSCRAGPARAP
jgi:ubiquinone/menaquinone biosynthesis C-methylase UbiE